MAARPWTVGELVRAGARRFRAARLVFGHGTTNARDEAVYLTLHTLSLAPDAFDSVRRRQLTPREIARVQDLFTRRIKERRPAAYLTREAWLGNCRFYVDERAIVPRSHIAGLLRENLAPWIIDPLKVETALDLCTGSGCLAVLLARSFPRARVDAADISLAALAVAQINARRYKLGKRMRLVESNLFSALGGKHYDLIVSNPPYVTAAGMRRLPREYHHEPRIALAGGADGLATVRAILRQAGEYLKPGALLVVEVGSGRRRVERAFPRANFIWPETDAGHAVFIASREQLSAMQD